MVHVRPKATRALLSVQSVCRLRLKLGRTRRFSPRPIGPTRCLAPSSDPPCSTMLQGSTSVPEMLSFYRPRWNKLLNGVESGPIWLPSTSPQLRSTSASTRSKWAQCWSTPDQFWPECGQAPHQCRSSLAQIWAKIGRLVSQGSGVDENRRHPHLPVTRGRLARCGASSAGSVGELCLQADGEQARPNFGRRRPQGELGVRTREHQCNRHSPGRNEPSVTRTEAQTKAQPEARLGERTAVRLRSVQWRRSITSLSLSLVSGSEPCGAKSPHFGPPSPPSRPCTLRVARTTEGHRNRAGLAHSRTSLENSELLPADLAPNSVEIGPSSVRTKHM